jgi:hypothetical protein
MRPLRSNQFRHVTMMDKDFSPIDAASLVAWFAWAEANATRLRRRLGRPGSGLAGSCAEARALGAEI